MKKKLLQLLLSSTILINGFSYGYTESSENAFIKENQVRLFNLTPEQIQKIMTFENKGDNWANTSDILNIFDPDWEQTNKDFNDINNNIYYLSKLLEGPIPGSQTGGVIKQVSNINEEINGYDSRITTAETEASEAKNSANIAENKAQIATTVATTAQEKAEQAEAAVIDKVSATEVNNIIDTQIASGGTIFEALGQATAQGGVISDNITNQITEQNGPIYQAITSGSSIVVDNALLDGGVIKTQLDTKANISDLDSYATNANLDALETTVNAKADQTALNSLTTTVNTKADQDTVNQALNAKLNISDAPNAINNIIDTQVASGGTIFEALGQATAQGGVISDNITNQITEQNGPIYQAITSGSSIVIDNALLDGGVIKTQLDTKANISDLDNYATNANLDALETTVNAKADQTALNSLTTTVNTKADQDTVNQALNAKLNISDAPNAINNIIDTQVASGGTIFEALGQATAQGGVISDNITNQITEQNGPIYQAITSGSSIVVDNALLDGGVIKTQLDTKANISDLDNYATNANLDALETTVNAKADQTALNSLTTTVNTKADQDTVNQALNTKLNISDAQATITNTMDSTEGKQIITNVINDTSQITIKTGSDAISDITQISGTNWVISSGTNPSQGETILNTTYSYYYERNGIRYYHITFYTDSDDPFRFGVSGAKDLMSIATHTATIESGSAPSIGVYREGENVIEVDRTNSADDDAIVAINFSAIML
ncbi:hypothetical protein LO80_07675 [Candidatus Francisella endociliophora]|uniref:Uncharacterized protein n=1 Tax=Candidatus Francisella endociliophora TaxID=653937 RepID=A0A097EQL4_9GAMM|nr:hypothetical protein [Francisella sp. FSC1006]AIT09860.1 hypothetical protein LO80_07675 [Francisella sp. FSC1006]